MSNLLNNINQNGFTVINGIFHYDEIVRIIEIIDSADQGKATFRKTNDLFAVRQFLKEIPQVKKYIFNERLLSLINTLFGKDCFVVKSIYFDKPEKSNWFVAWHQDLTIAVNKKAELVGYGPWTSKLNNFGVQPPVELLQDNFTIRIHLDNTNKNNGALKVIPGSHLKNVYRVEDINWEKETEINCNVDAGGVMIMRPLLMHASDRSTTENKRRVIHIEFSKATLPSEIGWAEKEEFIIN